MKSYQYLISFEATKYYSNDPNDYTKTFWNEFIKAVRKRKTKKELKDCVKKIFEKVCCEHRDSEIRITGITEEISYNISYLFEQKEYDELYNKIKEENEIK